jgi:hypothetical protein
MTTHPGRKGQPPSLAYAATNTLIWIVYAALVLAVSQVFAFHTTIAVVAVTLIAAVAMHPLRRRASHAAQRLSHP